MYLKQNGYATAAFIGAFPLDSRFGLNRGFDVYDESYGVGRRRWISSSSSGRPRPSSGAPWPGSTAGPGPWFVWVHCFDPHQPYEPPEPFSTRYKDDLYSGEVAYVDSALAKLFGFLEDSRQAGSTVVVFTGDHGQSLGEHGETTHGYFAYNSTLWVPLIVSGPGVKPGRVDQNVCHIDIFPTVCDLLDLPKPAYLQGLSLLPAIRGKDQAALASRPIYFESLYAYYRRGWAPLRGFIKGPKKFIDLPLPEVYRPPGRLRRVQEPGREGPRPERAELARLIKAESGPEAAPRPRLDAEAREKLQSLGYVGGFQPPAKDRIRARRTT